MKTRLPTHRMRRTRLLPVVCAAFGLACLTLGPSAAWPLRAAELPSDAEIRNILRNYVEHDGWGVGIVVGILDERGSRVISYGKLDHGDTPEVDGDTLFEIGSITKTFTALLLEVMIERGEMKLDDPVDKFLPSSVRVPASGTRKITLRDLATHTSGLPRDLEGDWTVARLHEFLPHCRLKHRPGRKAEYSNLGVALLAHAIELKAGTNFEALVQQRICAPLGMDSTCLQPTPGLRSRWAKSHGSENRTVGDIFEFDHDLAGAGGLRASANDMLKYAAAQLGVTRSPLTPLMEKTHEVQVAHAFGDADLALPWWIYHRQGNETISHGGATAGHNAFIGFDKPLRRAVVVLANRSDQQNQAVRPLGMYLLHPPATNPPAVKVDARVLDTYVGLYEFPQAPQIILSLRREGDRFIGQYLNCAAGSDWVPISATEFIDPWGSGSRMKLVRGSAGRVTAVFSGPSGPASRARRISEVVPPSLFQPMLKPLAADECTPRKDSDLEGSWDATARLWFWPFHAIHGKLRIAEPSPGVFRAEFDFPEQGANNQPVAVIYHSPGLELVVREGYGMFKGQIYPDHTKIAGHFIQGHFSVRVTLRRAQPGDGFGLPRGHPS